MNTTDGNTKAERKVEYADINENRDKGTENEENDAKMNTMDRNPKSKKKVEYEDIYENSDECK